MGRLTKKINGIWDADRGAGYNSLDCAEKLAHYEDLEEQGRLIEQKHGKWEPLDSYVCDSDCMWRCSECKVDLYFELGTPLEYEMYYCPHCGAKMELKELEGDHIANVRKMVEGDKE